MDEWMDVYLWKDGHIYILMDELTGSWCDDI